MSYLTAQAIAERVELARRNGAGWTGRCPAHPDSSPSLSIKDGKKATLVSCHAGCTPQDIVNALGVSMAELFHDYTGNGRRESSIDLKMRELIAAQRKDEPRAHETLGDVMWWTLNEGLEDHWFRVYQDHRKLMDMGFHDAMKMHHIVRDTVVWDLLQPWFPGRDNWHEFGDGFMAKMVKRERELRAYAEGR